MRLRHIEIFHAVYTSGSITNAAKLLHVSQPSVSKVLAHAELQLGFDLFSRVKGRLLPTPEADKLFIEADRIFNQMTTINELAGNIRYQRGGKISLGITPALGFDVIPEITQRFLSQHSDVDIHIHTLHNHHLLNHLLRQQSDIAIMFAPRPMSDIKQYQFGTGRMVAIVPNDSTYPKLELTSLEAMTELPYISIRKSGPLGDMLGKKMQEQANTSQSSIQVDTYYVAINLVKRGLGWCIIDEFTAKANHSEQVLIKELEDPITFPITGLSSALLPISRLAQDYIDYISDYFNKLNKT